MKLKMCKPDQGLINRLLIKLDPMFFSYPVSEQNKRRQGFGVVHHDKIYAYLYYELFGLEYRSDEDDDSLEGELLYVLNAHTTSLMGIGDNSFRLCEYQSDDFNLDDFNSVYDYDLDDFAYQKKARKEHDINNSDEFEYRLYLNHLWLRLLDSERNFYYSTLSSLSFYLQDALEDVASDVIDSLIPHKLIKGPEHGRNTEGGMIWDLRDDANGLEAELSELESRARNYIDEAYHQLNNEFHASPSKEVFLIKDNSEFDSPRLDIIFKNAETAKQISFTSFLSDCQKFLTPCDQLETLKARENAKLKESLIDAHQDIMENFDPKIVKLEKKMKMVITPSALDDLSKLEGEDD